MGNTQSKSSSNAMPSAGNGKSVARKKLQPPAFNESQAIKGKISDNNIYAIIVNTLSEGIIMIDKAGKVQAWNSRAAEIFGLDAESNFLGRALLEETSAALDENGAPFKADAFPSYRTLITGKPQFGTVIGIKQTNGKVTWISVNTMPVFNNADTPDAVVLSITDITKERADSIKLKQSQALFSTFIANSKTAAWVYDEEGNILMSNAQYDRFLNPLVPSAGKNIKEVFSPEFAKKLLDRNKEIFKNGVVSASYNDVLQQDGSVKNMVSYLFTIQLPWGEKLIAGQAFDLTEQNKAQARQKESQAIFGHFMKSVPILSWIYDADGKLIYGNDLFFAETGVPESNIGKNVHELPHNPQVYKLVVDRLKQAAAGTEEYVFEDVVLQPDGSKKHYKSFWFPIITPEGKNLIGGFATDITERKMHVARIKLMSERFKHVVNATSDAIWDIDLLTNEIFRSDNFSSLSGYKKEEIEPTLEWWYNKIHPDDRQNVENKLKQHLEFKKDYWESEYRFLYADGSYHLLNDRGFAIFENNHPVRLIGAIKDITEKRELEIKLIEEKVRRKELVNRASVQAQELERDRISKELHDNINQLLLSTKMYMSVVKAEYEDANGFLEKAIEYQMMGIEEVRKLSKALSSSVLNSIGLNDSLHGIVFNMQMAQQINVRYSAFENIQELLSNEQQLMVLRIVQEQTANIIKHANASVVDIVLSLHQNMVTLEVKDNGIGFDTSNKPSGVGLSNIRSRAQALKGNITIESSPGNGCQLLFSFPLS